MWALSDALVTRARMSMDEGILTAVASSSFPVFFNGRPRGRFPPPPEADAAAPRSDMLFRGSLN